MRRAHHLSVSDLAPDASPSLSCSCLRAAVLATTVVRTLFPEHMGDVSAYLG